MPKKAAVTPAASASPPAPAARAKSMAHTGVQTDEKAALSTECRDTQTCGPRTRSTGTSPPPPPRRPTAAAATQVSIAALSSSVSDQ